MRPASPTPCSVSYTHLLGGYYNELKFFIEGVRGDHPLDVATLEEAVRSVRLVKKEIEAAGGLIAR